MKKEDHDDIPHQLRRLPGSRLRDSPDVWDVAVISYDRNSYEDDLAAFNRRQDRAAERAQETSNKLRQALLDLCDARSEWSVPPRFRKALERAARVTWTSGVVQDRSKGPVTASLYCIAGPRGAILYARFKPYAKGPRWERVNGFSCRKRGRVETTTSAS